MKDKVKRDAAVVRIKEARADLGEKISTNDFIRGLDGEKVVEALGNVEGNFPGVIAEFVAAYNDYVTEELEYEK